MTKISLKVWLAGTGGTFCFLCCLVQLSQVIVDYFKYETILDMRIETFLKDVPSVTIAAPLDEMIESGYLKGYFRRNGKPFTRNEIDMITQNYSSLAKAIESFDEPSVKVKFTVLINNQYNPQFNLKIDEYSDAYIDSHNVYFSFTRELTPEERNYAELNNVKYTVEASLKLFKELGADNISLCIILHATEFSSALSRRCSRVYGINEIQYYGYWTRTVKRLPQPYSDCVDYGEILGMDSQATCFDSCVRNLSCDRCGLIPDFLPISTSSEMKCEIMVPHSDCFIKQKVFEECENKCKGMDCFSVTHEVSFEKFGTRYLGGQHPFLSISEWPNYPNFEYMEDRKLDSIDLIVYIGSSLTMWLGFSLYPLLNNSFKILNDRKRRARVDLNDNFYRVLISEIRKLLSKAQDSKLSFRNLKRFHIPVPTFRTFATVAIAFAVLVVQAHTVIERFVKYETAVDVYLAAQGGTFRLPAITFALNQTSVLNYTKLCESNSAYCVNTNEEKYAVGAIFINRSKTFAEIYKFMISPHQIFNSCEVGLRDFKERYPCFNVSRIRVAFNFKMMYYTLFDYKEYLNESLPFFKVPSKQSRIFVATIDVTKLTLVERGENFYVKIHSATMGYQKNKNEAVELDFERTNFVVQYRRLQVRKLPPPYQTSCFNYTHTGARCRLNCYNKCIDKFLRTRCRHTSRHFSHYNFTIERRRNVRCSYRRFPSIAAACNKECNRDDCEADYYDDELTFNPKSNKLQVDILYPQQFPAISYVFRPRYTLLDTVVYLGGILGVCFGISILGCLENAEGALQDIFQESKSERLLTSAVMSEIRRQIHSWTNEKHSMSLFKKVALVLALVGASIQVTKVLITFFQYPMIVQTTFKYDDDGFPAVSILDRTKNAIDYNVDENDTAPSVFTNLKAYNSYRHPITLNTTTTRISWTGYIYETLTMVTEATHHDNHQINTLIIDFSIHTFALLLHGKHVRPNINPMYSVVVTDDRSVFILTYQKVELATLPAPYATKCEFDGREEGRRMTCLDGCKDRECHALQASIKKRGQQGNQSTEDVCSRKYQKRWEEICYYFCEQKDCNSVYYFPVVQKKKFLNNQTGVRIVIHRPSRLMAYYVFLPKTTIIDLFIFLGSTLGLWLGLDGISIFMQSYHKELLRKAVYKMDPALSHYIAMRIEREIRLKDNRTRFLMTSPLTNTQERISRNFYYTGTNLAPMGSNSSIGAISNAAYVVPFSRSG